MIPLTCQVLMVHGIPRPSSTMQTSALTIMQSGCVTGIVEPLSSRMLKGLKGASLSARLMVVKSFMFLGGR